MAKTRILFVAVALSLAATVDASQPVPSASCVILKRASTGEHVWSGTEFHYVSGSYPKGMSFRTTLSAKHVREVLDKGGKFVTLEAEYTIADLEHAERACQPQAEAVNGAASGQSQVAAMQPMTNDVVIALLKAGLSDDSLLQTIRAAKFKRFDVDRVALAKLAQAGASNRIIQEMQETSSDATLDVVAKPAADSR
jgi:hypothetical protein